MRFLPSFRCVIALALMAVVGGAGITWSAEFRGRRGIRSPSAPSTGAPVRPAAPGDLVPVDPRIVRKAVEDLYATYTFDNGRLRAFLEQVFHDRDRVLDNIATRIPRDAKLTVLGLEAIQTLEQTEGRLPTSADRFRESRVAVLVRGQIEFSDPVVGFVRRRGVSEFILKVYERVP